MKAINILISFFQAVIVILYIAFYNVQYFWSVGASVMNFIDLVLK